MEHNRFIQLIHFLFFIWFLFVFIFALDFLGFIRFLEATTPSISFFFIAINLLFMGICTTLYFFHHHIHSSTQKEKQVICWQYDQTSALSYLINKTGKAMTTVLNRDKLMRLILESFIKIFHCPTGILFIYNENENIFEFEAGYGINRTALRNQVIKSNHPIVSDVVNNYKIISQRSIKSIQEKDLHFVKEDRLQKSAKGVDTLIIITLRIGDKIFGLVFLYITKTSALIISEYETLVYVAINQATIAIGSAIQSQFAIQDRLTMIYNHDYFVQRLKEELFRCKRYHLKLCLIMLDIDHFKSFNDTYGHLAGNYILREVAKIFTTNTRITDIISRYGGEEFAILMTETGINDAVKIAEKIREAIQDFPFEYDGEQLHVTVSIGLSEWDGADEESFDDIDFIDSADKKLYEAKKNGRNRVCL